MKRLNGNCKNCGCRFEFDVQNGYLTKNTTAQRLNNEVLHYKDNCEAWCKLCNCLVKTIIYVDATLPELLDIVDGRSLLLLLLELLILCGNELLIFCG